MVAVPVRGVVRERVVVATMIQKDAGPVVRCGVIRNVAVIRTAEMNPCLPPICCPGHIEPGDVHVIPTHLEDIVV